MALFVLKGGVELCKHIWKKHNDVLFCSKCGLTVVDGKMMFDKKLPSIIKKESKKK